MWRKFANLLRKLTGGGGSGSGRVGVDMLKKAVTDGPVKVPKEIFDRTVDDIVRNPPSIDEFPDLATEARKRSATVAATENQPAQKIGK